MDLPEPPDPDDEPEPLQLITRGPAPSADALRAALSLEPGTEIAATSGPELLAFVRRSLARNRQQGARAIETGPYPSSTNNSVAARIADIRVDSACDRRSGDS